MKLKRKSKNMRREKRGESMKKNDEKKRAKQKAEVRVHCNGDMEHGHYCLASEPQCLETEKHCMSSDVELQVSQGSVVD